MFWVIFENNGNELSRSKVAQEDIAREISQLVIGEFEDGDVIRVVQE
jgi:hypothetical protein